MRPKSLCNKKFISLFLVNLLVSVSYSMVSTTITKYIVFIGYSVALAGSITGLFSISSMVTRIFSGIVCDSFKKKWLLVFFAVVMGACVCGYGATTNLALLRCIRIVHGIAFSINTTVNMALVVNFIPEGKESQGIGYYSLGQNICITFAPTMALMLSGQIGFRYTYLIGAAMTAAGALLALTLDDSEEGTAQKKEQTAKMAGTGRKRSLREFLGNRIFAREALVYVLIVIVVSSTGALENSFIALYGASRGIENIGWYFTVSAVTLILSRMLFSKLADGHDIRCILYPGMGLLIVFFALLGFSKTPLLFVASAVIKAATVGVMQPALQAECVNSVEDSRRGAASATYFLGADIGQASAPVIGGILVDKIGYSNMFFCNIGIVIGMTLLYTIVTLFVKKGK